MVRYSHELTTGIVIIIVQERHRVIRHYASGGGQQCNGAEVEDQPCHADCSIVQDT